MSIRVLNGWTIAQEGAARLGHAVFLDLSILERFVRGKYDEPMAWQKPDPVPNMLHTAFAHVHETHLWASKSGYARYTFNYDLMNSPNPSSQVFSIRRIPTVPRYEKLHGHHPPRSL
jgi:DNA modification methylase